MALSLSTNWKKLQETLKKEEKRNVDSEDWHEKKTNGASTVVGTQNPLKRKEAPKRGQKNEQSRPLPTKKLKLNTGSSSIPKRSTVHKNQEKRMGAYVSSLPTASYAFLESSKTVPTYGHISSTAPVTSDALVADQAGKYVALDCEMVGTLTPCDFSILAPSTTSSASPEYSILARCTIVSYTGATIYDAYVLPPPGVIISDYRTQWSGISAEQLNPSNPVTKPQTLQKVREEVADLLRARILVGHSLSNDLGVLGLEHPKRNIRDTAHYKPFRELATAGMPGSGAGAEGKGTGKVRLRKPSLKRLARIVLGWDIQMNSEADGEMPRAKRGHDSAEDARTAMALFRKEKDGFEQDIRKRFGAPLASKKATAGTSNGIAKTHRSKNERLIGNDNESEDGEEEGAKTSRKKKKRGKKKGKYR